MHVAIVKTSNKHLLKVMINGNLVPVIFSMTHSSVKDISNELAKAVPLILRTDLFAFFNVRGTK